jgi:hypothetical protein
MKSSRALLVPVLLCLAALGAECPVAPSGPGVLCTAEFRFGLNVTVVDSISGANVPRPILIVATEGTYSDTSKAALNAQDNIPFASWPLVGERAGTYTVLVRAAGYQDWQRNGVRIDRDACHVIPVALTARLRRS